MCIFYWMMLVSMDENVRCHARNWVNKDKFVNSIIQKGHYKTLPHPKFNETLFRITQLLCMEVTDSRVDWNSSRAECKFSYQVINI